MAETSNASQSQVDINQIATDLNNKADRDLVNTSVPTVISRTVNSLGGIVEIWSDGYCVQTGCGNFTAETNTYQDIIINLSQSYRDLNYILITSKGEGTFFANSTLAGTKRSVSQIKIGYYDIAGQSRARAGFQYSWRTEGYIR